MNEALTSRASIEVFTFKEGVFAKLAHDLRLSLLDFDIRLEGGKVQARFGLSSLRVDGVAHGERIDTRSLSSGDLRRIRDTMQHEILEVERFPDATFEGAISEIAGTRLDVVGSLSLHGHPHELRILARYAQGNLRAEATLTPSHFGIAPYKALGGAIRLQDRVVVRGVLAVEDGELPRLLAPDAVTRWSPRTSGSFSPSGT